MPALALRQLPAIISSTLMLLGVILAIPFVILIAGLPIVLVVQLVLWIGRLF